ncbi:Crp/Fnr family transcriptional regulator [Brachybacterium sp. J144]|uniref:Crp/Fnr family transcriptional regulator n=1 Tax=Brachybacterium sp. J144 TaxID=3116487 RepID=UPI002E7A9754|nr:Crp/Fnr family transcriptional regulator [Brachybacterium sp. J144]MEE1651852.1 Crp/Fnr family transcriptional regulator [Brachybacterium sp. J144]
MTTPDGRRTIPLAEVTLPHTCPAPVRLGVLDRSAYFHGLSEAALERIDRRMRTLTLPADAPAFRAGEPAEALYVVAEGRLRIAEPTPSGALAVTDILGPGQMFGAMSSLGEPFHRRTATALVGTCLLRIGQEAFREVMVENPVVGLRVVDDLAARLSRAQTDLGTQSTDTVEQRVARALLRLADSLGEDRGAQGLLLEVPLSRADLAGLARSTPESVSRVMSALRREGIIDSGRRWTSILDRDALEVRAADGGGER